MSDAVIRPYREADQEAVVSIWRRCDLTRPWNDPYKDIERKVRHSPEGFLVAEIEGEIVGTAMVGYDGHRGWVNYLAVLPDYQREGLGARLMAAAEATLIEMGCPKLNLQVRISNTDVVAFYETLNYRNDDCVSLGKRLIADV